MQSCVKRKQKITSSNFSAIGMQALWRASVFSGRSLTASRNFTMSILSPLRPTVCRLTAEPPLYTSETAYGPACAMVKMMNFFSCQRVSDTTALFFQTKIIPLFCSFERVLSDLILKPVKKSGYRSIRSHFVLLTFQDLIDQGHVIFLEEITLCFNYPFNCFSHAPSQMSPICKYAR